MKNIEIGKIYETTTAVCHYFRILDKECWLMKGTKVLVLNKTSERNENDVMIHYCFLTGEYAGKTCKTYSSWFRGFFRV